MPDWDVPFKQVEELAGALESLILDDQAGVKLSKYFDPQGGYSGAWFERLGADVHGDDEFGCHDLLSLNLLNVRIPGLLIRDILEKESFGAELSARLAEISTEVTLWDSDATASLDQANELWGLLRRRAHKLEVGMGDTKLSKLLARKRPHLIPISDEVVKTHLPPPRGLDRWTAYRSVFRQRGDLVQRLAELRGEAGVEPNVSLLRVLDVITWRRIRMVDED